VFNVSGGEIIVILLLALVVLGPEKLPEALRRAGRTYAELKKMGNSFQTEMRSVLDEPMKEMRETADLLRQSADFTEGEITGAKRPPARPAAPGTTSPPAAGSQTTPPSETKPPSQPSPPMTTIAGPDAPTTSSDPAPAAGESAAIDHPPTPDAASTSGADTPDEALINRTLSGGQ
jgi:sec-independent protein translocase protein TatB